MLLWKFISIFGDEITSNLDQLAALLRKESITSLDLRKVFNKNILDTSYEERKRLKIWKCDNGILINSISTAIGKVEPKGGIKEFAAQIQEAISVAKYFDSKLIRIFCYKKPPKISKNNHLKEISSVINQASECLENIIIGIENDKNTWCSNLTKTELLMNLCHPNVGMVFDPANFVQSCNDSVISAWRSLQKRIKFIHIKDALRKTGEVTLPGDGDGHLLQILRGAEASPDIVHLVLEPHIFLDDDGRVMPNPYALDLVVNRFRLLLSRI